jgi:hypothetical protein
VPEWLPVGSNGPLPEFIPPQSFDTTNDEEQHQQQSTLQQPEDYSQNEQVGEADIVSDVLLASSGSTRYISSSTAANVSSLLCPHCQRGFPSPGRLKYVFSLLKIVYNAPNTNPLI